VCPFPGGPTDHWDLEVRGGLLGGARVLLTVEEHGAGRQYLRARIHPHLRLPALVYGVTGLGGLSVLAWMDGATGVGLVLGGVALFVGGAIVQKCGAAVATLVKEVRTLASTQEASAAHSNTGPPE
jgi:hypothetical protein